MSPHVTIQSELIDDAQTETASVDQLERDQGYECADSKAYHS